MFLAISDTQYNIQFACRNTVFPLLVKFCGPYLQAYFSLADNFSFDTVGLLFKL